MLPIERLKNVNDSLNTSSISWEILQIDTPSVFVEDLMVPQSHSEKILIFQTSEDAFGNLSLQSFVIDPNKMTKEEESSYPDF